MLSVEALTVRYRTAAGAVTALSDITLAVPRGGTLAIVGESGSGKSTVALALTGLLPPEAEVAAGRIEFDGIDLRALDPRAWEKVRGRRISLVFQDPFSVMNPSLRVGDQIGEGLRWHRGATRAAARARAVELLREVGISDPESVASAYPHELSGGMRQRALIAGALSTEPELLVLDEPTTALDVTIEAQILDLLQELQSRRQLTMLFITHNLGVVRRVADEVAVVYAGQVIEHGRTRDMFERPLHPYTKGLLAAVPRIGTRQGRLASIPGRLPDLRAPPPGCRFEARCPFALPECGRPQVLAAGAGHDARCWRAPDVAAAPWPVDEPPSERLAQDRHPRPHAEVPGAAGPRSARDRGASFEADLRSAPQDDGASFRSGLAEAVAVAVPSEPIVVARDVEKSFVLTRGLAALKFDGWRPVLRPVRVAAVDGVSLTVAPGEVLGLVGESGSGKTTLGRALLRLVEPDRGEIRIAGETITGRPQASLAGMRRQAQIVFQNPDSSLNPRKRVGELIARPLQRFGIVPAGEVAGRVRELLDLVRLPAHFAGRYPHQMSGGEKQRVGIARALATEPRFLVCDEPVSALDVSVQAAIVNLLADLRDRLGVAYLFISHDISVVAHLADRIAVMYRGRIVEIGPAAEVMRPPFHPYTEALLSAVPTVDGAMREPIRLPLEPRRTSGAPACVFSGRCPRRIGAICDDVVPPERRPGPGHVLLCHHDLAALAGMEQL